MMAGSEPKMKPLIINLIAAVAVFVSATPMKAQTKPSPPRANVHALHYGKKCIIKQGSIIAVSEESLRRFAYAAEVHDTKGVMAKMVSKNLIDAMIVDAIATPVAPHGWAADVVEIHIPGYFRNVFAPRVCLDGDVKGYLAEH
jgi:hypothetical protein